MAVKNETDLGHAVAPWQPIKENVYGSVRRLRWIRELIPDGASVLEVGCGTGYMITMPLLVSGVDARGLDLDARGIAYAQEIARLTGLDPDRFESTDLAAVEREFDVVVLSEVLEHQTDEDCAALLGLVHSRLSKGGLLLVTVPNGRGWFERESWAWRHGLGRAIAVLRIDVALWHVRRLLVGDYTDAAFPSAVDSSPHLQRFSIDSIARMIESAGFTVQERTGTVLVAGPVSNMLVTGIAPLMRWNCRLGARFPARASGFMVAATKR